MKWQIPAKTFLVGEYAALADASAIVLTTTPCFELSLDDHPGPTPINVNAPASIFWQQQKCSNQYLHWTDPYQGIGGLGASGAQFLGAYMASCTIQHRDFDLAELMQAYYQCSWSGTGLRPSGYDIIAQSQSGCVFINKSQQIIQSYPWPFADLSFILIHTGVKLATHEYLQDTNLPLCLDTLSYLSDQARKAFEDINSTLLVNSINQYHQELTKANRVASHSLDLIEQISKYPEPLAIKGCGAMGADIVLIVCPSSQKSSLIEKIKANLWTLLATENNLYKKDLKFCVNPV